MTQPDTSDAFRPSFAYRIAHDLWERLPSWLRAGAVLQAGEVALFEILAERKGYRVTVEPYGVWEAPIRSITVVEGELTHDWWRDEYDTLKIGGTPLQEIVAALPVVNREQRHHRMSPTSEPYVVEEATSFGKVRLVIEARS